MLKLTPGNDTEPPVLKVVKANHTKPGMIIDLAWRDKVLCVADSAIDPEARRWEVETMIVNRCRTAWEDGQPLTNKPQAIDRYLPKVLARRGDFNVGEIKDAMDRMSDAGRIKIDRQNARSPTGFRVCS